MHVHVSLSHDVGPFLSVTVGAVVPEIDERTFLPSIAAYLLAFPRVSFFCMIKRVPDGIEGRS